MAQISGRDARRNDVFFEDRTSGGSPTEEGQVRRVNDDLLALIDGTVKSLTRQGVLYFGAYRILRFVETVWLISDGGNANLAPATPSGVGLPSDCTLQRLLVTFDTPGGSSENITVTVYVDGVATAISVTMAANASSGSDFVNTATATAGSKVTIAVTKGTFLSADGPRGVKAQLVMG